MMTNGDQQRLREFIDAAVERGETRLPPEPRLATALGVTRGRLRTLLQRLEDEQLIWRHVGKGTFIGQRRHVPASAAVIRACSVDEFMDARAVLEPQLAAQAAVHARPADLFEMEQCLAEMGEMATMAQWKRLDNRLHRAIAAAAHNELLLLLYDCLHAEVHGGLDVRIEAVYGSERGPKEHTDRHHRDVVEAIARHDPEAAEAAMRSHLRAVREELFGLR